MTALIFNCEAHSELADTLAKLTGYARGSLVTRHFPDGETYVRFETDVKERDVFLVCSLFRPDNKILPLLFAAKAARSQGARSVQLIAPYLAYLRQDASFHQGEAVTAASFAELLSSCFDALVTVDPHLHRLGSLDQVYAIPTEVVHAAEPIATWIAQTVKQPLLIGPDAESEQWVREVARILECPFVVGHKDRFGDRDVQVTLPDLNPFAEYQPVLLDDIISTGHTMIEALGALQSQTSGPITVVAIHAVFADEAIGALERAGAGTIATCNTIPHASNQIDMAPQLAACIRRRATRWNSN